MNFLEFKNRFEKAPVNVYPNLVSDKVLVSVCVQTYNQVNFIKNCLDGILMQVTDFEFEVVLGDDDSNDGTHQVCLEYAQMHPNKIRFFRHSRKNNIVIGGRSTGRFNFVYNLFSAYGKYVALCEGDDYWIDTRKLQKQVDFLECNRDFSICFHDVLILEAHENNTFRESKLTNKEVFTVLSLAERNVIHTPSCVFRNIHLNFPQWFCESQAADYPLHLFNARLGKIKRIPETMAVYRIHQDGAWSLKGNKYQLEKWLEMLEFLIQEFQDDCDVQTILTKQYVQHCSQLSNILLNESDMVNVSAYLVDVFNKSDKYAFEWFSEHFDTQRKYRQLLLEYKNLENSPFLRLQRALNNPRRVLKKIASKFGSAFS